MPEYGGYFWRRRNARGSRLFPRVVKKLMRLPDGKNGVVRRAARESEPGFGAIFALAGREQQYIAPALMIPFVVMVGDVILQSETKRLLSEEYELRQALVFR